MPVSGINEPIFPLPSAGLSNNGYAVFVWVTDVVETFCSFLP